MARILYWTQLFWPYIGGVEVLGARYVLSMRARGHDVEVITSEGSLNLPNEDHLDGVPIHRLALDAPLRNRDLPQLARVRKSVALIKQRLQPDVVHINFSDPSVFFHWQTEQKNPSATLVTIHVSLPQNAPEESLVKRTLRSAKWVTTASLALQEDVLRLVPEIGDRCSVVYGALEPPEFAATPLCFDPAKLACIGRVVEEKGFDLAVRAMVSILREFPDTQLTIAGDGSARAPLQKLAEELGIAHAVRFAGWIAPDKVSEFINRSTFILVPSRWREAFGLVALQAAQLGRPVIAANIGGLPEIVLHEKTGLLFPPEDDAALAEAVLHLMRDPQKARQLGSTARNHSEQYQWQNYVDKYEVLCQKLLREKTGS